MAGNFGQRENENRIFKNLQQFEEDFYLDYEFFISTLFITLVCLFWIDPNVWDSDTDIAIRP